MSSRTRGTSAATSRLERRVPGLGGEDRVVEPDHRRARRGRREDPVIGGELVHEAADQRQGLVAVAGVEVHLAAARLLAGKLDSHVEPLRRRTAARPTCGNSRSLKQVMNNATRIRPPAGLAVGPGGVLGDHRRKAAATPESTGMCSPVVCDRSPPMSANTAAATCSGRTSLLSRVRWA